MKASLLAFLLNSRNIELYLSNVYIFLLNNATTPLKIRTEENSRTVNTPTMKAKGSTGAKNPVNGTLVNANPASIHAKKISGY